MSAVRKVERQLAAMAELQDALNVNVHPQWRDQGHAYYRAIWVECAELLDHYGWKWWKHQHTDLEQVKLEIVDIWHFGLSQLIFLYAVLKCIMGKGAKAPARPWEGADTLEWTVPSPAPYHTFETPPVVK